MQTRRGRPPCWFWRGMYEKRGDFRRVEDVCRKGLAGNPSAADIADRLLALLERQGRFTDAENILKQVEINPRLASAWQVRMALGAKGLLPGHRRAETPGLQRRSGRRFANSACAARVPGDQGCRAGPGYLKDAEGIAPGSRTLIAVKGHPF